MGSIPTNQPNTFSTVKLSLANAALYSLLLGATERPPRSPAVVAWFLDRGVRLSHGGYIPKERSRLALMVPVTCRPRSC
jgi:hypothetical protein